MIKSITASLFAVALVACAQPATEVVVDPPVAPPVTETPAPAETAPPAQLVDAPPQNEVKVP
jgi:hypothetical protein